MQAGGSSAQAWQHLVGQQHKALMAERRADQRVEEELENAEFHTRAPCCSVFFEFLHQQRMMFSYQPIYAAYRSTTRVTVGG